MCVAGLFELLDFIEIVFGKVGQFGERLEESRRALLAGESCEGEGCVAGAGDMVKEMRYLGECLLNHLGERALEIFAEGFPVLFALEDEVAHPAVAILEHLDELVFHLMPVVVSPEEESLDSFAESYIVAVDLFERLAGGAAVEFVGLLVDAESIAETGEKRLLGREVTAARGGG